MLRTSISEGAEIVTPFRRRYPAQSTMISPAVTGFWNVRLTEVSEPPQVYPLVNCTMFGVVLKADALAVADADQN